jgi:DNA-binding NarL/FixJ family response regulator
MVGQVLARLGELRLRQGRHREAEALFERAPTHPTARLGQAALALERGAAADAAAELKRFLEQIGGDEPTLRAGALELAVRAFAGAQDFEAAVAALAELQRIAKTLGTEPLAASAAAAEGALRRAQNDTAGAIACFERAAALYQSSGAPYETARAHGELAELLAQSGERPASERMARTALAAFHDLGATHDETRLRQRLKPSATRPPAGEERLTERQIEILRLVAQGMSNPEIAARLRLSDHTVKRHVANLLARLRLPSRAAAVAYAATQGLL